MTIELTDDFVPYYVNDARLIAYADRPEVKRMLDEMEAAGTIVSVIESSDWAAPSSSCGSRMTDYACASTIID